MSVPLCLWGIPLENPVCCIRLWVDFIQKDHLLIGQNTLVSSIYSISIRSYITFVNSSIHFILSALLSQHCFQVFAKSVQQSYTEGSFVFSSYCDLVEKKEKGLFFYCYYCCCCYWSISTPVKPEEQGCHFQELACYISQFNHLQRLSRTYKFFIEYILRAWRVIKK